MRFTARAQGRSSGRVTDDPKRRAALERYVESQRARPQARPAPSAGMAVNRVLKPLGVKGRRRGSSALALADIWGEIMGPRWGRISAPVRFRGSREGRTLVISAPGPAAALIMAASGPILERLNAHYGTDHVQRLQVVQAKADAPQPAPRRRGLSPSEEARLQAGLEDIGDERLRRALERLGRAVIGQGE